MNNVSSCRLVNFVMSSSVTSATANNVQVVRGCLSHTDLVSALEFCASNLFESSKLDSRRPYSWINMDQLYLFKILGLCMKSSKKGSPEPTVENLSKRIHPPIVRKRPASPSFRCGNQPLWSIGAFEEPHLLRDGLRLWIAASCR